jgi:hypothetical protein
MSRHALAQCGAPLRAREPVCGPKVHAPIVDCREKLVDRRLIAAPRVERGSHCSNFSAFISNPSKNGALCEPPTKSR